MENNFDYAFLCRLENKTDDMEGKNLVIVESPGKVKTIEKYLGKDYTVKASIGHIRDLQEKAFEAAVEENEKADK